MDILTSFAIICLAALIHASFQLSVSVLTLLSGHAIGSKKSQARLFKLTISFVFGAGIMTMLLLSFTSLVMINLFNGGTPQYIWASACGLLIGVALSVWLFYYSKEKGTVLWIPRGVASYLTSRTKSTKISAEAFGLGLVSVIGEILFIVAPIFIASLALIQLPPVWQLLGIIVYTEISLLSLSIVWLLISRGHNLGKIQKWRETNKNFMQFMAGAGLVVLAFYVYVVEILGSTVGFQ